MKKILMLGLGLCLVAFAPQAHAQSAEYTEGYNAGYENMPPPAGYSDDYLAGWQAGKQAEQANVVQNEPATEPQPEPSDQTPPE